MKGYVYILSNPSMPGMVKIGRTVRSVHGRAGELFQTGVPTPFVVEHSVLSPDCAELERKMHDELAEVRVGADREFFSVDVGTARDNLDGLLFSQILDFVQEYLPDHTVADQVYHVEPYDLSRACQGTDAHPADLAPAIYLLEPDAVQRAVNKRRAIWEKRLDGNVDEVAGGLLN